MSRSPSLASLTPGRRQLVQLLQHLHFGRVENLLIRDGEPVFEPPPRVVREVKFPRENPPGASRGADFLLKQQVVELLNFLDQMQDGTIAVLDVKHGLPFRVLVEDRAA